MNPRMVFGDYPMGYRETIVWWGYKSLYNVLETAPKSTEVHILGGFSQSP